MLNRNQTIQPVGNASEKKAAKKKKNAKPQGDGVRETVELSDSCLAFDFPG